MEKKPKSFQQLSDWLDVVVSYRWDTKPDGKAEYHVDRYKLNSYEVFALKDSRGNQTVARYGKKTAIGDYRTEEEARMIGAMNAGDNAWYIHLPDSEVLKFVKRGIVTRDEITIPMDVAERWWSR